VLAAIGKHYVPKTQGLLRSWLQGARRDKPRTSRCEQAIDYLFSTSNVKQIGTERAKFCKESDMQFSSGKQEDLGAFRRPLPGGEALWEINPH
jgi:hypothetical protein